MCLARGFAIPSTTSPREYNEDVEGDELQSSVFTTVNVGYLILSSTLGIIVGDVLWLEALCILGAKHVIVIDSIKPFGAAILGRVVLDEVLMPPAWGGMILTVVGVGVVAWEEQRSSSSPPPKASHSANTAPTQQVKEEEVAGTTESNVESSVEGLDGSPRAHDEQGILASAFDLSSENNSAGGNCTTQTNYKRGYTCALVNVLADSVGSLLTRKYGEGMTTWSINLIRFGFAGVVLVGISTGMRLKQQGSRSSNTHNNHGNSMAIDKIDIETESNEQPRWFELPTLTRKGWARITTGVGLVTFLCPALSNYSLFQIALGLAVSLGSVGPLYGLILDWPFNGKRPTVTGCVGALFAVAGVVLLCFWGTAKP